MPEDRVVRVVERRRDLPLEGEIPAQIDADLDAGHRRVGGRRDQVAQVLGDEVVGRDVDLALLTEGGNAQSEQGEEVLHQRYMYVIWAVETEVRTSDSVPFSSGTSARNVEDDVESRYSGPNSVSRLRLNVAPTPEW